MSDDLIPYSADLPAVPDHGGAVSIPDAYSNAPALAPDAFTPNYADDGQGAIGDHDNGHTTSFFGTQIAASPERVQREIIEPVAGKLYTEGSRAGVDPATLSSAVRYFQFDWMKAGHDEPVRHSFRIPPGFTQADRPALNRFLNFMARCDAKQADVTKMLSIYIAVGQQLQAAAAKQPTAGRYGGECVSDRDFERAVERSEADADACATALRIKWGVEYVSRLRSVRAFVAGMHPQQRDMLETSILADGRAALNCPEIVERLYLDSVGPAPANVHDEIAAIEKTMRENRKAYNADLKLQERLRYLYGIRAGT